MKPTAILVNTSRGPIVDEAALIDVLREGRLRWRGPRRVRSLSPCRWTIRSGEIRRVVLTPHIGDVTKATYANFYRHAVEDVAAFLAGSPIRVLA